jgi:hypothetical protein
MIHYFYFMVKELLEAAKDKVLKSEQVEILMIHFSGAAGWASCATDESSCQSRSTSPVMLRWASRECSHT